MPEYLPLGSFRQGLLPGDCGSCAWWFTTGASNPGDPVASAKRHEWLAELEHTWGPAGLLVHEPAPRRRAGAGDPVISASIHFAPASSLPRFRELPFPALPPSSALLFCFHADEHAPHWMAKELIRRSLYELRRRGVDEVFAVAYWSDGDDRDDSCRFFRADFLAENGFAQVAGDSRLCLMRIDNRGLVSLLSQMETALRRVFSRSHEPAPSPAAWLRSRPKLRAWMLLILSALLLAGFIVWGAAPGAGAARAGAAQAAAPIWVTRATGIIDPALADYLTKTMKRSADAGAAALVIEMDTPGGLDSAMRQIIQAELDAPIPVILYVYPQGARAASAGVYILMGSDIAAMAPQTNLGAATPVALGGTMDDTEKAKVTNDAAAYIVALAKNHGRNATWAEDAVRNSVSLPADQALAQNVIDFVAPDLPSLLKVIDGAVTQPKGLTLHTAGAPVEQVSIGWVAGFLHGIANPNIAYILMIVGILGIALEIAAPGHIVSGVVGVIALLLSFYGLAVLPVSFIGIALIVLALILFVAEIKIQSHGALGIGGVIALVLGGLLLFNTSAGYARVAWPVLVVVAVLALALLTFVITKVRIALRRPHATGRAALVGQRGATLSPLDPRGQVRVRGEIWKARTRGEVLLENEPIEVLSVEGLTLVVRRIAGPDSGSQMELTPER